MRKWKMNLTKIERKILDVAISRVYIKPRSDWSLFILDFKSDKRQGIVSALTRKLNKLVEKKLLKLSVRHGRKHYYTDDKCNERISKLARIDLANQFVRIISEHGRRFFHYKGRVGKFIMKRGHIYWVDELNNKEVFLAYRYWTFHNGGTLRSLVNEMYFYIKGERKFPIGFVGPWPKTMCNGDLWGYRFDMEVVRYRAFQLLIDHKEDFFLRDLLPEVQLPKVNPLLQSKMILPHELDDMKNNYDFEYFSVRNGKAKYHLLHLPDRSCGLYYCVRIANDGSGLLEGFRPIEPTDELKCFFREKGIKY